MKLLTYWPMSEIEWWNKNRILMNEIIDIYNKCQLKTETREKLYEISALNYMKMDIKGVDYSLDMDIIIDYLKDNNFDVSFYKGFGNES